MKRTLAFIASLAVLSGAHAAEPERFSLKDYNQRVADLVAACTPDPAGAACRVAQMSVLPSTVEALSFLGYQGSYDKNAAMLRDYAAYPVPQIATAAIYALARLGPHAEDLPVIREALLSDVAGLRRAALGALKILPDPQAQTLYKRGVPNPDYMPSGSSYRHDPLPFDPKAAGVTTWPEKARYLYFRDRRRFGTYVFTTTADVAGTVALFEAQSGTKAVGFGEIAARFDAQYGDLLAEWKAQNESEGAVQAIMLHDPATPSRDDPALVALVFDDYPLGATGFALVRLPGDPLPTPNAPPEAAPVASAPTEGHEWFDGGAREPKAGATADDVTAWKEVLFLATLDAARDYLAKFPEGAYRAEAEAMLAAPALEPASSTVGEGEPVKLAWHNMPVDRDIAIRIAKDDEAAPDLWSTQANETPMVTTADGEVVLAASYRFDPGIYVIRAVDRDGELIADTNVQVTLGQATLTLESTTFAPGAEIAVAYADMAGDKKDFISIAKAGATDNDYGSPWQYTNGGDSGRLTLLAPSTPGAYEVRAYYRDERDVRARVAITVGGAAATPAPGAPPATPTPTPATPAAPNGPATITIPNASVPANSKIEVTFANFSGAANDYVSVAVPGSANTAYLSYAHTGGGAAGKVVLTMPAEPGDYELRAFFNEDESEVKAQIPIKVTPPEGVETATLTLDKQSYQPGETILIDYANMSGSQVDYVATAEMGAKYSAYLSYVYTKGAKAGRAELKAPTKPGTYEVRAFYNEDESILRGAVTFTVVSP